MYGPLCWQGYEKISWRFQEADVVWNHEGVQLQKPPTRGPSAAEIKKPRSRTDNLEKEGKNGRRSWTTSSGLVEVRRICTSVMTSKYGTRGIITRFTR